MSMAEQDDELLNKVNELLIKQEALNIEVNLLKSVIERNSSFEDRKEDFYISKFNKKPSSPPAQWKEEPHEEISKTQDPIPWGVKIETESILTKGIKKLVPADTKQNIEKFVGENLISVIGIIILITGVGIGAKYAIEHDMISPLTRIIIGYLIAVGLLVLAIRLKEKYEYYSAVLLSGALALMYFLTFAAYDFYDLIPKMMAFGLMLVFTVFTAIASIKYNRQVIAHIGFVGAYAVPFLLSDGTGSVTMLFVYVTIINFGILAVSLKNYWKSLYYTAFGFTWLIFIAAGEKLDATDDLATLLTFLTIFYLTFYAVFMGYKLIKIETFKKLDIILVMSNSFVFYGLGYAILSDSELGASYLGLFTLINALIHFGFAAYINKQKIADKNLFYLIIGLVLTFITIAIPVQLNGHWVTLLWIGEASLLFWIGRTKQVAVYEKLSYPLMVIAFISIFQDWDEAYGYLSYDSSELWLTPFFNVQFLSSIIVVAGFAIINYINTKIQPSVSVFRNTSLSKLIEIVIPSFLLVLLFASVSMEIKNYWDQAYRSSMVMVPYEDGSGETYPMYNSFINQMGSLWGIIYTLFFATVLSLVNIKKIKNRTLGLVNLGFNALVLFMFLTTGLLFISELRGAYLHQEWAEYYTISGRYIGIRYISLFFVSLLFYASYTYTKQEFLKVNLKQAFALVFYASILWILSSELIHWLDYSGSEESYKLGLSILWGVYSLALIIIGIFRKYKQIRLGALGLFAITLLKLFFYDMSELDTIAKTIVFVVLGVLLLLISFLYNKFKYLIEETAEGNEDQEGQSTIQ